MYSIHQVCIFMLMENLQLMSKTISVPELKWKRRLSFLRVRVGVGDSKGIIEPTRSSLVYRSHLIIEFICCDLSTKNKT
jgi:hypothetical protein